MEYKIQRLMIALLKSAVDSTELTEEQKALINEETLQELYKLSAKHDMAHLVGYSLKTQGFLKTSKIKPAFEKQIMLAVFRYENMSNEIESIVKLFEEEKVDFILLKGAVIKELYPEKWMRTYCDTDLLVREDSLERAAKLLEEKLGYFEKGRTSHDISFTAPSGVSIELHFDLLESDMYVGAEKLLGQVWSSVSPCDGYEHKMEMSDELQYYYHIVHMAKHFGHGGCGVRPFVDLWLMKSENSQSRQRIINEGGLAEFEKTVQRITSVWFEKAEHNQLSAMTEEYVLFGGVYGNYENRVFSQQAKQGGKIKYLISRTFLPMESLKQRYPKVKKYPILAPVYQFERMFTMIREKRVGRALKEMKINANISKDKVKKSAPIAKCP